MSVFDFPYPWKEPDAQELRLAMLQLNPTPKAAADIAEMAGVDLGYINLDQPPVFVWRDILTEAGTRAVTRNLVTIVRDRTAPANPRRPFLDALLADEPPPRESEPRGPDGAPSFIHDTDDVAEPEALLYRDDLTMEIGRVPAFVQTLQRLIDIAPSVCRLIVMDSAGQKFGSGFRIGDDLILTNWHVLHERETGAPALSAVAEFGYDDDGHDGAVAPEAVPCNVASIVTSQADDWALIGMAGTPKRTWPVLKLSEAAEPQLQTSAFIIQHPLGQRKRLGFVRNQVSTFNERVVQYLTDTQEGSSGSPVLDEFGRLIALHHAGGRPQVVTGRAPLKKNEGIRIPRIIAGLAAEGISAP